MNPQQTSEVMEILDSAHDLTLATVRDDGYPQATTVGFAHDGLKIYFGCDRDSQKAHNLESDDKISLTVNLPYESWSEIRGLSLGGRAHAVTDPEELDRADTLFAARFPQIGDFIDEDMRDEGVFFRIDPEVISLLDYRKGFGHKEDFAV